MGLKYKRKAKRVLLIFSCLLLSGVTLLMSCDETPDEATIKIERKEMDRELARMADQLDRQIVVSKNDIKSNCSEQLARCKDDVISNGLKKLIHTVASFSKKGYEMKESGNIPTNQQFIVKSKEKHGSPTPLWYLKIELQKQKDASSVKYSYMKYSDFKQYYKTDKCSTDFENCCDEEYKECLQ